jgi:hypothetical protein
MQAQATNLRFMKSTLHPLLRALITRDLAGGRLPEAWLHGSAGGPDRESDGRRCFHAVALGAWGAAQE